MVMPLLCGSSKQFESLAFYLICCHLVMVCVILSLTYIFCALSEITKGQYLLLFRELEHKVFLTLLILQQTVAFK